jgi:hypothetical protein
LIINADCLKRVLIDWTKSFTLAPLTVCSSRCIPVGPEDPTKSTRWRKGEYPLQRCHILPVKQRLSGSSWSKKRRRPNQGLKKKPSKGACAYSKTPEPSLCSGKKNFLNEEHPVVKEKQEIKKPWAVQLKGIVRWLTMLKLIASIVNEVRKFFK